MQLRVILTGASGFVGEGVLLACLENPDVKEIVMVNRRHVEITHPKLKELIVADFTNLSGVQVALTGYNACFYCAGISSVGLKEDAYTHITYTTTLHFAEALLTLNPGMVFNFISGRHADSSEKGRVMWARVKGKIENALIRLPFKAVYTFRPGGMKAFAEQKNAKTRYKLAVGLIGLLTPRQVLPLEELAQAMINAVRRGYSKQILEIDDIRELAAT